MENKTAVQWLEEQLYKSGWDNLTHEEKMNICATAKLMEREQIKNSFVQCWKANIPDGIECKLDAEQYYKETYRSK